MGLCNTCNQTKKNRTVSFKSLTNEKDINNNNNISPLKGNFHSKSSNTNIEGNTKASSESSTVHHKPKPEIYSIEKFGVQVKLKQNLSESLKFIFHIYNFKCKMLTENTIYIMQIIFDGKEYPLSFGSGNNPSFIFDETIGKEILFNKMSTSYMDIYLYTHKNKSKNVQVFKNMTKGEILSGTQLFSCLKIDLLTLALAPEKHDIVLLDPKRNRVQLGRINYNLSCRQIEDISIKVKSFKINLFKVNYNEIALNLKYENVSLSIFKETEYTDNFHGTPNTKDNSITYQYNPINHEMNSKMNSKINLNNNKENLLNESFDSFDDLDEYDNSSNVEKLILHGKMSLYDIFNSEITLNIYSVRLKNRNDLVKVKRNDLNLNICNTKNSIQRNSIPSCKDLGLIRKKLDLIKTYNLIGIVSLNFYKILYDNENRIERDTSKFFHSVSNQNYDELNRTISDSKINGVGVEESLNTKKNKHNNENKNKESDIIQNILISSYENVSQTFIEEIINYDGDSIGNIELFLEISKLPLIKQTMFGVLTETGFEINSIFLYDNLNISNNLPEELLELIKLKERFEQEISTNIQQFDFDKNILNLMKHMKSTLEKTIDDSCLYYGYSSDKDIYQGQEVFIDLGLILFELIDKLGLEHRKIGFEILKLILKRSEIDLGTLSVGWFKTIRKTIKIDAENLFNCKNYAYDYEFRDIILLERGIIEKFFKFHLEAYSYSLDNIIKGKNIDNESRKFTNYYLSIAYFLIPMFREELINQIYSNINLKDEKYLKYLKNNRKNYFIFSEDENANKTQSNFILWDDSFYKKLNSSLSKFKLKKNSDVQSSYIQKINSIKEQLSEIKYITNPNNNNKKDLTLYYSEHNWCNKIKNRGFIFYDYIVELLNYILKILNQIDENNLNTKWTKIPGIDKILEVINYDLITKDAKNYQKQIYEILPIFYSEISITNLFISSIITKTNIYDTQSIFALINILDYLFNKEYDLKNFDKNIIKEKIDYKIIQNSFFAVINTENSLAIAKFIWFYYKNISLLSTKHVNKIITHILLPNFFILFFHWSFQIREIFYYFLVYIINHKIKRLIKPHKIKESNNIINENENINKNNENNDDNSNNYIFGFFNVGIFGFQNKEKDKKENEDEKNDSKVNNNISNSITYKRSYYKNYYFFGDLLDEKMKTIEEIRKIIGKEKYDTTFRNIIDEYKYKNIIENIPEEYHSNIILGINHYNKVLNEYEVWDKKNKEKNIKEKDVVYPSKDIRIIKDDTIQYNN